jgi:hypothetical protein
MCVRPHHSPSSPLVTATPAPEPASCATQAPRSEQIALRPAAARPPDGAAQLATATVIAWRVASP